MREDSVFPSGVLFTARRVILRSSINEPPLEIVSEAAANDIARAVNYLGSRCVIEYPSPNRGHKYWKVFVPQFGFKQKKGIKYVEWF